MIAEFDLGVLVELGDDGLNRLALLPDSFDVFLFELDRVSGGTIHVGTGGSWAHRQNIRSKLLDLCFDCLLGAFAERDHRDYGTNSDDNTEHCQYQAYSVSKQ